MADNFPRNHVSGQRGTCPVSQERLSEAIEPAKRLTGREAIERVS
jgi:hypothetical protein